MTPESMARIALERAGSICDEEAERWRQQAAWAEDAAARSTTLPSMVEDHRRFARIASARSETAATCATRVRRLVAEFTDDHTPLSRVESGGGGGAPLPPGEGGE